MSGLTRYPSYKDSGVPWLGEIPSHWHIKRLKFMAKIKNGTDYKHVLSDEGYPVIGSGGQFATASEYLYEGESVLLGRKGTIDKPIYVNCAFWTVDTMYYTIIEKNTFPKYLFYCALTVDFWKYSTSTALPSMTQTALSNLVFAVPDYNEQELISIFLDKQLNKIDTLMSKQKSLLDKLTEQRSAVIVNAITKGLDSTADLKESNITWLGEYPQNWKVLALQYILRLRSGNTITALSFLPDGDYPVYGGNGLRGYIDDYTHCGEFVLIGRQGAYCGNVHIVDGEFFATEHAVVANPTVELDNLWLYFLLKTMDLNQYSTTAAQPGISTEMVGRLRVPFPHLEEQKQISSYLKIEVAKIDNIATTTKKIINSLKEYRSTLITQAVTGKIDVRDFNSDQQGAT